MSTKPRLNVVKTSTDTRLKDLDTKLHPENKGAKLHPEDDSDEGETDSSEDDSDGGDTYYVEMSIMCVDDEGEYDSKTIVMNFETEDNYIEHAETGFEDLVPYFQEAVITNFIGWTYADECEELEVYGPELPDDHDEEMVIIDIF